MPSRTNALKPDEKASHIAKKKGRPKKWAGPFLREALAFNVITDLDNHGILQSLHSPDKGTRSLQGWRRQVLSPGFRRWRAKDKKHTHRRVCHLQDQDRPGSSLGRFSLEPAEASERQQIPNSVQLEILHEQPNSVSQIELNRITFRLVHKSPTQDVDPEIRIRLGRNEAKNKAGINYTSKMSEVSKTLDQIWDQSLSEHSFKRSPSWSAIFSYIDLEMYPLLNQDRVFKVLEDKVTKIAMNNCRLTTIPSVMLSFPTLRYLNLQRNRLNTISSHWLPKSLIHLDLRHNQIIELPADFLNLKSLKILAISHNQVSELPSWLPRWNSLQLLYADGNPLKAQSYMYYHSAFQYGKEDSKYQSCLSCLILATKALKEQLATSSTNIKCGPLCHRCSQEKLTTRAVSTATGAESSTRMTNDSLSPSDCVKDVENLRTFLNRMSILTDTTRNSISSRTVKSMSSAGGRENPPGLNMQSVRLIHCCHREAEDERGRCIHHRVHEWVNNLERSMYMDRETLEQSPVQDLSSVDVWGNTTLHIAASFGATPEALLHLIEQGCSPDAVNLDGETFLHRVATGDWGSQDVNVVRLLVHLYEMNFKFEHRDNSGSTIYHTSEQLTRAVQGSRYVPDFVQRCHLKRNAAGAIVNARSGTRYNSTSVMFECCGQRPGTLSDTPRLCFQQPGVSVREPATCKAQCILEHTEPLHDLARLMSLGYDKFLVGPDLEPQNCTSTLLAILEKGADVNEYNENGLSVLMVFVRALSRRQRQLPEDQIEGTINLLLEWGANASGIGRHGDTVLHHVVHNGLCMAISPLVKHKANVNARNGKGLSVMQLLTETMHKTKSNLKHFGSFEQCVAVLADERAEFNPSPEQALGWPVSGDRMSVLMGDD